MIPVCCLAHGLIRYNVLILIGKIRLSSLNRTDADSSKRTVSCVLFHFDMFNVLMWCFTTTL